MVLCVPDACVVPPPHDGREADAHATLHHDLPPAQYG